MKRRLFITGGIAAGLLPGPASATYDAMTYEWGMRSAFSESPQTVILNFRSSWSLTCRIKEDLLAELKSENPEYRSLTFIDVDVDTYGPSQWVERLGVRRRSTLVAMRRGEEIARVENEPRKQALKRLLDQALTA